MALLFTNTFCFFSTFLFKIVSYGGPAQLWTKSISILESHHKEVNLVQKWRDRGLTNSKLQRKCLEKTIEFVCLKTNLLQVSQKPHQLLHVGDA